ncbi:hypothetical protein ACFV97_26365 [Streptomyces sp. NPDC059913]|uniref:hypothetical protein n=1 Tax=unclassified Streptomyces TaxID=2593676 RepID=UPI0033244A31
MKHLKAALGATAATVGTVAALVTGAGAADASSLASPLYGCPSGAACVYAEGKAPSAATLTDTYWSYGAHDLKNQYNSHWVANNQTGGASITLCYGYGGTTCTGPTIYAGGMLAVDLTKVNSIRLNRS